jgi:OmpA-OmpF porin, OOP family
MRSVAPPARLVLAALWLAAAGPALADAEVYGGAGVGYGAQAIDQPPLILGPGQVASRDLEGSDLAWQVFAGLRLHRHMAIEAGYVDLGSVKQVVTGIDDQFQFVQLTESVATTAIEATLVGVWPLSRDFELFGKLGLVAWDAERGLDGAITSEPDGEDLAYGFGVDYRGTGRLRFRVQGMQYDLDGFDESIAVTASVYYALPIGR